MLLHFFLIPCFNLKVQREKEFFVLNCPPHDLKLSKIDYDDRSEEEQHRNNNFLQTFCQKNVKSWRFRQSGYAKAEVPLSKICDAEIEVSAESEVPLPLLRKLQNLSQCDPVLTHQALRSRSYQGRAQELAEGGGGCGKSQTALLVKIFLGTGQPQGLLYLIHWEAQPQAKPINRNDFQVNIIIEV